MLTAADVEQKTFSTALRGYDLDEVDDFLDEIVATIRDLNEQLEEAKAAAVAVPAAPAPAREPAPVREIPTGLDESAIGRALVAAQTAADKLLEDAQAEAGKIVDGAKSEADTWKVERDAKRAEAESEMARLTAQVASVRSELAVLADDVAEKLDDMDAVIEGRHSSSLHVVGLEGDEVILGDVSEGDSVGEFVDADAEGSAEVATSETGETDTTNGGPDHLDEILTGVATDLQLGAAEEGSNPESDDEPEDGDEGNDGDVGAEDDADGEGDSDPYR
jgi:DivIVA domain-containing protein